MYKKIKRIIGLLTIALGVSFTALWLLQIWGALNINLGEGATALDKLMPTLGILTLGGICLLGILKMIENKNGQA